MTSDRTRVAAVADRLGCTEGQIYTMTIGLTVAILLLVLGLQAGFGPPRPVEAAISAPSPLPAPESLAPSPSPLDVAPLLGVTTLDPQQQLSPAPIGGSGPPTSPTGGSPPPSPPCAVQPVLDASGPVLEALKATGVVPSDSIKAVLGVATGCNTTDPTIVALGLLAEIGSGIPDPGVTIPGLTLPFVELPPSIVDAVQPLRPIIDPACDAVGSLVTVVFYGFATYPLGIDTAILTAIREILIVCGQLRSG